MTEEQAVWTVLVTEYSWQFEDGESPEFLTQNRVWLTKEGAMEVAKEDATDTYAQRLPDHEDFCDCGLPDQVRLEEGEDGVSVFCGPEILADYQVRQLNVGD